MAMNGTCAVFRNLRAAAYDLSRRSGTVDVALTKVAQVEMRTDMVQHRRIQGVVETQAGIGLIVPANRRIDRTDRTDLDCHRKVVWKMPHPVIDTASSIGKVDDRHVALARACPQFPDDRYVMPLDAAFSHIEVPTLILFSLVDLGRGVANGDMARINL